MLKKENEEKKKEEERSNDSKQDELSFYFAVDIFSSREWNPLNCKHWALLFSKIPKG